MAESNEQTPGRTHLCNIPAIRSGVRSCHGNEADYSDGEETVHFSRCFDWKHRQYKMEVEPSFRKTEKEATCEGNWEISSLIMRHVVIYDLIGLTRSWLIT